MKKNILKLVMVAGVLISLASCHSSEVVTVRPAPVVVNRINPPSPRHVWVEGEYLWRNGHYVYQSGYWVVPTNNHRVYTSGYWAPHKRGYIWVKGHWR